MTLKDWTAKRSGAGITVRGTDIHTGKAARIVHIVAITPPDIASEHHVLAHTPDGATHRLAYI